MFLLLCLGIRFPQNFRFFPHDRVRHNTGPDVYALHNEHTLETIQFMEVNKVLCEYCNIDADLLTSEGVVMLYPKMSPFCLSNLLYEPASFYADMTPS